jgi:4-hydroxybenzoate polyprenyltransferase
MQKVTTYFSEIQKKFWNWFLNQQISLWSGVGSFIFICLVRIFLENFSSESFDGLLTKPLYVINFILFYTSAFLSIMFIVKLFTKLSIRQIFTVQLFFFWITALVPVVDLLVSSGACIDYITQTGTDLLKQIFTFGLYDTLSCGISWGIRSEVILFLLGVFSLIYHYAKKYKLLSAITGFIFSFISLMIIHISLVGIIESVGQFFMNNIIHTQGSWIQNSLLINNHIYEVIQREISSEYITYHIWMLFSSRILFLFIFCWFIAIISTSYKSIFQWFLKTLSWKRIMFFFTVSLSGMTIANGVNFKTLENPVDIVGVITLGIIFIYQYITATVVNDIEDQKIDILIHPERPLVTGVIELNSYKNLGIISFILAILGATTFNYVCLFLIIIWQGLYYIYSTKPFKLKRHWAPSFIVYIALGITTLLIGYFSISKEMIISFVPVQLVVTIGFFIGVSSLIKDVPDYKGDKQENIQTFAVVFGPFITMICASTIYGIGSVVVSKILTSPFISTYGVVTSIFLILFAVYIKDDTNSQNVLNYWTKTFIIIGSIMFIIIFFTQMLIR